MGAILTDCVRETLAVRWFDTDRGFGFCTWEGDIPRDVFLHMNTLRTAGFSAPADGARVTGLIVNDHDRLRFATVEMVEVPPVSDREVLPKETLPADLAALPLEPARVKWFDTNRGFGFLQVFGSSKDVFLHADVLRAAGIATPQPGEAMAVRKTEGRRGVIAAQVASWEAAATKAANADVCPKCSGWDHDPEGRCRHD